VQEKERGEVKTERGRKENKIRGEQAIRRQGRAYRGQGGTGIGPGGKNICSTPGMEIRSKG